MTCAHVLGLIDAGDFADYPREHLEEAWRHARQCATCGPALEMASRFTSGLAALPQPAPPRELLAGVLADIERIEHRQAFPVNGGPAYYNTGSGIVPGVITGLELQNGALVPVRWTEPRRACYVRQQVSTPRPLDW